MKFLKIFVSVFFLFFLYFLLSILTTDSYIQYDRPSKEALSQKDSLYYKNYEIIIKNSELYNTYFKDNFEIILDDLIYEKSYGMFYLFKHKISIQDKLWIAFLLKKDFNNTYFKISYDGGSNFTSLFADRIGLEISKSKKGCLIKILSKKNEEVFDILVKW